METAASADVRVYRLRPETEEGEQRRARAYVIPSILVVATLSVVWSTWIASRGGNAIIMPATLGALYTGLVAVWLPIRTKRRIHRCWQSYELRLGPDFLERAMDDVPTVRLPLTEIRRIQRVAGRYLRIFGNQGGVIVSVPEAIEGFPDVLNRLEAVARVQEVKGEVWQKQVAAMALGLGGFTAMMWAKNPVVVLALSLALAGLTLWVFWYIRRSQNVNHTAKRRAWIYLFLLLPCVLRAHEAFGRLVGPK